MVCLEFVSKLLVSVSTKKAPCAPFLFSCLDEFIFYPEIPENHSLIAKIILAYNSLDSSGTAVGLGGTLYNNNNASIIYIKHEAENFASPGVQDVDIFNNFFATARDQASLFFHKERHIATKNERNLL